MAAAINVVLFSHEDGVKVPFRPKTAISETRPTQPEKVIVAVGTTIADRPPHRSVRAR
jgi:hypothetical protein